jgi:hypothetical protein
LIVWQKAIDLAVGTYHMMQEQAARPLGLITEVSKMLTVLRNRLNE